MKNIPDTVIKSDGNGNTYEVDNPAKFIFRSGYKRKLRFKPTNITPKKKKRK